MSALSATIGNQANPRAAKVCGRKRNYLRFGPRIVQTARGLFPVKTAIYLHSLTGDPVRTWEYWLSKERLPAEALGALLASEHGLHFLDAIAGGSTWWRAARRALAAVEEREAKLQEAIHALVQTSTSFRFQDVAGGSDRPVARRSRRPPPR